MTVFTYANFFETTVAAAIGVGDTTITVANSTGAPSITGSERWAIVLQSATTSHIREVVYVTAITSNTFTVVRAQEGTTSLSWAVGDSIIGSNTTGVLENLANVNGSSSNIFAVANAAPSTQQAIPITQADARYAALAGSAAQVFSVADAVTAHEAVALEQFVNDFATQGSAKLPGGLILNWGEGTVFSSTASVTFVTAFPNAALHGWVAEVNPAGSWVIAEPTIFAFASGISTTGGTVYGLIWNGTSWTGSITGGASFRYIVIGY